MNTRNLSTLVTAACVLTLSSAVTAYASTSVGSITICSQPCVYTEPFVASADTFPFCLEEQPTNTDTLLLYNADKNLWEPVDDSDLQGFLCPTTEYNYKIRSAQGIKLNCETNAARPRQPTDCSTQVRFYSCTDLDEYNLGTLECSVDTAQSTSCGWTLSKDKCPSDTCPAPETDHPWGGEWYGAVNLSDTSPSWSDLVQGTPCAAPDPI